MVKLFGKNFSREELLKYVGDIAQIARIRHFELLDGNEKSVEVAQVHTGSGLVFDVLLGRGMDISYASYKGIPLSWRSHTGDVAAQFFEPQGLGWLRGFHGGLLTTCGLTYAGAPCIDNGKDLGLHGRASYIPAKVVCIDGFWEGDDYKLVVKGKVRESMVFGENVSLTREISTYAGESRLFIHDIVENMSCYEVEHMIIYHINIGFPLVDDGSRLLSPSVEVLPRDEEAEKNKADWDKFSAPTRGFKEKVYYHKVKPDRNGNVNIALVNTKFNNGEGIGIYVRYSIKELMWFIEWKMMGIGIYVVGLEPANCQVGGRAKERSEGRLQYLKPYERKEYKLEIGVLSSMEEINNFQKLINGIL
jgi:hypothetical protein